MLKKNSVMTGLRAAPELMANSSLPPNFSLKMTCTAGADCKFSSGILTEAVYSVVDGSTETVMKAGQYQIF